MDLLKQIGDLANSYGHRLTFHPGQYNVLASPNSKYVKKTIEDLQYHADVFDLMGIGKDGVMVIHGGGIYGDKNSAFKRWIDNYHKLPDSIKNRLVLENCELFPFLLAITFEIKNKISPVFTLTKRNKLFSEISDENTYNLIYFDAFGARVQPELWTEEIFEIMYKSLKKEGVLVTYSAKGSVRRAMQKVGFLVEKLPGPPGKREMLRAIKK